MGECSHVGCSALELVEGFPGVFLNTAHYYFKTYRPEPGVEVRLGKQVGAELRIRELIAHNLDVDDVVKRMLKGIEIDESRSWIKVPADDMCSWLLRMQAQCRVRGEALALYSRCQNKDGRELHIPMMDFRIKSGEGNAHHLSLLSAALQRLGQCRGVLLDSGNSYHYYGFELLTPSQWKRFMAACLLLDPLVDVRYISHRMLAGKASLRLNEISDKRNPKVVACLHKY
jgi:hypothetical protein